MGRFVFVHAKSIAHPVAIRFDHCHGVGDGAIWPWVVGRLLFR